MRSAVLVAALCCGCFQEAPPVDDVVADDDSSSDGGESEDGEESSSSGDAPADPLDAYGPCEVDTDCPLIPGDDGEVGESPRCVQGTCAIRCAQAAHPSSVCPGNLMFAPLNEPGAITPILCGSGGYCTVVIDPYAESGTHCPDGMFNDGSETIPELACMWQD